MHRSNFIYTAILVPLDYLALLIAGLVAYTLRKSTLIQNLEVVSDIFYEIPQQTLLLFVGVMALVWILFFISAGLYNERTNRKFVNQITKIFLACTAGTAAVIIFFFFKREFLFSSRFIILSAWGLSILFVIIERVLVRIVRRMLHTIGKSLVPIIVVGEDNTTKEFIQVLSTKLEWGYRIVSHVHTIDQLHDRVRYFSPELVIVTDKNFSREKINEFLSYCQTHHIDFRYAAEIFSTGLQRVEMDAVAGFPLIEIKRTPLEGWGRVSKRIVDIVLSLLALIVLCMPCILVSFIIKLTSPGPLFVKLTRIGEGGKKFRIYKFRSMIQGAHNMKESLLDKSDRSGPLFKMKDDPRITPFGRIIRRFSIDEFPNFYNVLLGNMSLVGPRPHEPEEVQKYREYQKKLLNIKPGITGLAQISGRSNLAFDDEARLDLYYVENWSLKLDFTILLKTPFVVLLRRDGAV